MMKTSTTKDLRSTPRFDLQNPIHLLGSTLPVVVRPAGTSRRVEGHVQNVSSGGLCLLAPKPLKVSEILVGEIAIPGTRASIPTLLQVRWQQKGSGGTRYRAGLNFVLQAGMTDAMQTPATMAGVAAPGRKVKAKAKKKK